jgi:hypothetical protein
VVLPALAPVGATSPAGTLLTWQLSHASALGLGTWMAPAVPRLLKVLSPLTPAIVTLAPWQLAQLTVMLRWLNAEPLNLALAVVTGKAAMLEPVPTWHPTQSSPPIETCVAGVFSDTMIRLAVAYLAALALLWHCAQLALVGVGPLAWIAVTVGITE